MSETTYSTAQIANLLKLTRAMVNKYALTVEEFQGKKIPQTAKDGRQFSTEDYQIIANAKFLVDSERVTLNTAIKMALGQSELIPAASNAWLVGLEPSQALEKILRDNRAALEAIVAANQANNDLLIAEISRLANNSEEQSLYEKKEIIELEKVGTFTKIGQWIDKRLRGS